MHTTRRKSYIFQAANERSVLETTIRHYSHQWANCVSMSDLDEEASVSVSASVQNIAA